MVSNRANNIQPSLTLALAAKAGRLKQEGKDIVSFTAGEPDSDTPDFIKEAAIQAMRNGHTKYTASGGIIPLREAICKKLQNDNGLSYTPKQIVVSNGAKHSLYNALLSIINEGDEVIILAPYWLTYPELVNLCGGVVKTISATEKTNFKVSPSDIEKAITKKTKAIIFNNPSNPTGIVYTKKEVIEICKVIEKAGIYLISDEIYEKLVFDGIEYYSPASYSEMLKDKTILVNGVSKSFSMTGWRIGYAASNLSIAAAMDNIQSQTTSNANSIAQHASVAALTDKQAEEFLSRQNEKFSLRRDFIVKRLQKVKELSTVMPSGAFYVMVGVKSLIGKSYNGIKIDSAGTLSQLLLSEALVASIPCESFGCEGFLRLSYCLKEETVEKGILRIEEFIRKLA